MSTPIGHTLAGSALASGLGVKAGSGVITFLLVLFLSNLPDIDLLFGAVRGNPNMFHHQWTHSLAFCAAAGTGAALLINTLLKSGNLKGLALLFCLILVSHLILDLFTKDSAAPFGIQLFWPFSDRYFISPVTPLPDVYKSSSNRTFFAILFSMHNLRTVGTELIVFGPLAGFAWILNRKRRKTKIR